MTHSTRAVVRPVQDNRDAQVVENLAEIIWTEHYTPIIGAEQVRYMLRKLQSASAVLQQIRNEAFSYFIMELNDEPVGYIGVQDRSPVLFLSKVYVQKASRGHGLGRQGDGLCPKLGPIRRVYIYSAHGEYQQPHGHRGLRSHGLHSNRHESRRHRTGVCHGRLRV